MHGKNEQYTAIINNNQRGRPLPAESMGVEKWLTLPS